MSSTAIVFVYALCAFHALGFAQAKSESYDQNGRALAESRFTIVSGDEETETFIEDPAAVHTQEQNFKQNSDNNNVEAEEDGNEETEDKVWTTCSFGVDPILSCADCNSRVICKPVGGLVLKCNPNRPYCNNGICSFVPSAECT